jgi:hypothetical protein
LSNRQTVYSRKLVAPTVIVNSFSIVSLIFGDMHIAAPVHAAISSRHTALARDVKLEELQRHSRVQRLVKQFKYSSVNIISCETDVGVQRRSRVTDFLTMR